MLRARGPAVALVSFHATCLASLAVLSRQVFGPAERHAEPNLLGAGLLGDAVIDVALGREVSVGPIDPVVARGSGAC